MAQPMPRPGVIPERTYREPTVSEMTRSELKKSITEAVVTAGAVLVLGVIGFAVLLGIVAQLATN